MAKKQKYDWKKTAKKVGRVTAEIVLAGILVYITDNPAFIAVAPILELLYDYVKHKN